jgi:3-oxoadipate enol-lactonase
VIATLAAQAEDGPLTGARSAGDQGPAVLFVHGVGSTAAIWDYQLEVLADSYRCLAIELRGNGVLKPEPAPALITRAGFANDVLAVARYAGLERFHVVGCSLGGVVAFELWKRVPERIASLTFVGSFAAYPNGQLHADTIKSQVLAAGNMTAFSRERVEKLGMPPGRRKDESYEQMAIKSVPSYLASTQAVWTGDYRSLLPTIDAPTLVVVGERDNIAPVALSEEIVAGIPAARLEILANAGHVANADAPAHFNALLRDFLEGPEKLL